VQPKSVVAPCFYIADILALDPYMPPPFLVEICVLL
jgi:hypothetical protein